jgi:DNA-binding CsgD family transcriptional regulator
MAITDRTGETTHIMPALNESQPLLLWLPRPSRLHMPQRGGLVPARELPIHDPPITPPAPSCPTRPVPPALWPPPSQVREWLTDYQPVPLQPAPAKAPTVRPTNLVEPLTLRETELLQLLAAGYSNREIAQTLVLSVGTVKWHLINIYGKLGVQRRTQAVARGRALGLLPAD